MLILKVYSVRYGQNFSLDIINSVKYPDPTLYLNR